MKSLPFSLCLVASAAGGLAGLACRSPEQREAATGEAPPAARHAMHSEQLRKIMLGMGNQAVRTWPQEIASERAADAEHDRQVDFDRARRLSAALGRAAGQIPQAIQGVDLTDGRRAAFLANAEWLRMQADELEALAKARDFDKMHETLHTIRDTCNGCHSQFRELIGPVELPPNAL